MVIGNGLVAKAFDIYHNDTRFLIFASGVSNSTGTDDKAFEREETLLKKAISESMDKVFIYFSTCSIYDEFLRQSPYTQHKINMEDLVKQMHSNYHIFRVSNLVGHSSNPNTVLNYFFNHISSGNFFYLWKNAFRNIIDIDDAFQLCDYIIRGGIDRNQVINVANPINYSVVEIVETLEIFLNKKGNYAFVDKESNPVVDITRILNLFPMLKIDFGTEYLKRIITKYYSE